jgi:8-oxo-dGTP pyrophosphatase MutT (NUDIX family)
MRPPRRLIRTVFTFFQSLRRLFWIATGPGREGVHAVPLTPEGKVVLVRLTYAPGWRLPGGGRKRGETAVAAMLRELREEIGLVSQESVDRLEDVDLAGDFPGNRSALFRVAGVRYRPRRWSLEVEEVREFDPDRLPGDVPPWTEAMIAAHGRKPPER